MWSKWFVLVLGATACSENEPAVPVEACTPFTADLPFRIGGTLVSIGSDWATTSGSEYVRLGADGQVVTRVAQPDLGDGPQRLAWNGAALAYVTSDDAGAFLRFLDADGHELGRGPSADGGPLRQDVDPLITSSGDGFDAAFVVQGSVPVAAFGTADATGGWTSLTVSSVPTVPYAILTSDADPSILYRYHKSVMGDATVIGAPWTPERELPVYDDFAARGASVATDGTTHLIALHDPERTVLHANGGSVAVFAMGTLAVARTDAWEVVQVEGTSAVRARLADDLTVVSTEPLWTGPVSLASTRTVVAVADGRVLFAIYDAEGTTTHLEQRCLQ